MNMTQYWEFDWGSLYSNQNNDSELTGLYYGTSDDFDEAREGYYPGFYVLNMSDFSIVEEDIIFSLKLNEGDLLSKPVELKYSSVLEVPKEENPRWVVSNLNGSRSYSGKIYNDRIVLDVGDEERVFIKIQKWTPLVLSPNYLVHIPIFENDDFRTRESYCVYFLAKNQFKLYDDIACWNIINKVLVDICIREIKWWFYIDNHHDGTLINELIQL